MVTMKTFVEKVRDIVRRIPKGKSMTYKEVAAKAGNPQAARAVGAIMRTNYDPTIPCHRVVKSNGETGGFAGGSRKKAALLCDEGVRIKNFKVVDFAVKKVSDWKLKND